MKDIKNDFEEQKSLMAEALAALEKAKVALAESEQALNAEKRSQQKMEIQLSKTRNMLMQAKENSGKIARVIPQSNVRAENAGER